MGWSGLVKAAMCMRMLVLTFFDERVQVGKILQNADTGRCPRVRHRLVYLMPESLHDVGALAEHPKAVSDRDRRCIRSCDASIEKQISILVTEGNG